MELFTKMNDSMTTLVEAVRMMVSNTDVEINGPAALTVVDEIMRNECDSRIVTIPVSHAKLFDLCLHESILTMRLFSVNLACEAHFGGPLTEMMARAEQGEERAILNLVKLEPGIMAAAPIVKLIDFKSLIGDHDFFERLSKAIRFDARFWKMKDWRNRYALSLLAGFGYQSKPYHEWADFFSIYNSKYYPDHTSRGKHGFPTYEDESTVAKACKRYNIPKIHANKQIKSDTKLS